MEAQVTDRMIAVVDDDESVRSATVDLLLSLGFACEAFESAEAYLKSDAGNRMSCLILDVGMPGLGGLELQQLLTDQGRPVPIIFITSFPSGRVRRQAIKGGGNLLFAQALQRRRVAALYSVSIQNV